MNRLHDYLDIHPSRINDDGIQKLANIPVVLFVPQWYQDIASRNKLTLTQLLRAENFFKYLSQEDQILFFAAQDYFSHGIEVSMGKQREADYHPETRPFIFTVIKKVLELSDEERNRTYSKQLDLIVDLYMTDEYLSKLLARLNMSSRIDPLDEVEDKTLSLPVVHVNESALALVIPSGQVQFEGKILPNNFHNRAVEAVLKELYVYLPQVVVNATVWFKYHVRLLAKLQQH